MFVCLLERIWSPWQVENEENIPASGQPKASSKKTMKTTQFLPEKEAWALRARRSWPKCAHESILQRWLSRSPSSVFQTSHQWLRPLTGWQLTQWLQSTGLEELQRRTHNNICLKEEQLQLELSGILSENIFLGMNYSSFNLKTVLLPQNQFWSCEGYQMCPIMAQCKSNRAAPLTQNGFIHNKSSLIC